MVYSSVRNRKGSLQIDYVIAMGIFIIMFAFILYYLTNHVSFVSSPRNEIRDKGIQAHTILFKSEGLPNDWESGNTTVRVGLVKKLYRVPIYVYSNTTREAWPVEATIDFDDVPHKRSITLTDVNNTRIPVHIENVTDPVDVATVYFVTNLSEGRNVFYAYYTDQNVTEKTFVGMNITSSSLDSDCEKKINNTKLVFHLCNGSSTKGAGIRSLVDTVQNVEVSSSASIDQPYLGGDMLSDGISFNFTVFEEGPVFAKYRLTAVNENTTMRANYSFYNGSRVWKLDYEMATSNAVNRTIIRANVNNIFDKYNDSVTAETVLPDSQTFTDADYGVAMNSTTGYVLATAAKVNVSFEFGWNKTIAPEIRSTGTPSAATVTLWHFYGSGNISNAKDLHNEINVTVLSREVIDSIGFEKLDGLSDRTYDTARSSLDMGQDNFFIKISNDTEEFFSYGVEQKKRDVYVESGKTLIQRSYGDIEFVTYTIGVWR